MYNRITKINFSEEDIKKQIIKDIILFSKTFLNPSVFT